MNRRTGNARLAVLALLLAAFGPALRGSGQELAHAGQQFAISPISLQVPPPPTPAVAPAMQLPPPPPADTAPAVVEEIDPRIKAMVDKLVTDRLAQEKKKPADAKPESTTNPPFKGVWKDGFWFQTANKDFTLHLGGSVQYDASFYNPQTTIQTGPRPVLGLEDGANLRRARMRAEGTMYDMAEFRLEMEFAQGVLAPGADPGLRLRTLQQITLTPSPTDAYITLLHLPVVEHFRVGNFKEPFGLEHLESHRFLYFMERSPLFDFFTPLAFNNGRCPGMMVYDTLADDRMSYAIGVFKNVYDAYGFGLGDGEFATTGRLTFLPLYEDEGRYLLHVGVAGSHRDPVDGQIRFRSRSSIRNQTPIVPVLIDTGFITSSSQSLMGLEAFVNLGSLSLQAEYMSSWNADSAARNGPVVGTTFYQGWYVQALYWLTGEYTQWSKTETRPDRPRPLDNFRIHRDCNGNYNCGWGAWQIGVRYSHIDANNLGINGGLLDDITVGLNWFLNPNIKFQWNYVWERRYGLASGNGNLNAAGMRLAFDW